MRAEGLWRADWLDRFKPVAGAPAEGSAVLQIPPGEAVSDLWPSDHAKNGAFIKHFDGFVAGTGSGSQSQTCASGVSDPDLVSQLDLVGGRGRQRSRFHGQEQAGIQSLRAKVFLAQSSKPHCTVRRGIHMPLYARALEVLDDHPRLNSELADRKPQDIGAAVLCVEAKEAEADIVSCFGEVTTKLILNHRVRGWAGARSSLAQEFSQRTQVYLARVLVSHRTLHPRALEVLDQQAALCEGFGDRGTPCL